MEGWRYYNHALVPSTPPHVMPDTTNLREFMKREKRAFFARWTQDFDCGFETDWWYVIRRAPYRVEDVSAKEQKSIRQALKKCTVVKIEMAEHAEDLYRVYSQAFRQYQNADNEVTREAFLAHCHRSVPDRECFGVYLLGTQTLIGYMQVQVYKDYVDLQIAKFDPQYLKSQPSDALYHVVLDHYLNERGKDFVSSGTRSINHTTGTQDYKIRRFGYQKAYCRLCILYRPGVKILIRMIYPFRRLLGHIPGGVIFHQLNAVLKMEEIARGQSK